MLMRPFGFGFVPLGDIKSPPKKLSPPPFIMSVEVMDMVL
jgi:hypothetical protein